MISATTPRQEGHLEQLISKDVSVARGLLGREALLQKLDRAVTRRITIISAPAGTGKTSLLRAWADRSTDGRRVALMSVDRDEQDAQRFWSAVLDALRSPAASIDPEMQRAVLAGVDGDQLVDMVRSELADLLEPVVLIVDDLHELRSTEALAQLERCWRFCRALREWCCRLAGIRRSGCTGCGLPTRSPRSGPTICDSPSARRANYLLGPGSACPRAG